MIQRIFLKKAGFEDFKTTLTYALRLFLIAFMGITAEQAHFQWKENTALGDLERVDEKRDTLSTQKQPPLILTPLTDQVSQIIGTGKGYGGIDYNRGATLTERETLYKGIMRTCMIHSHKGFFDHAYFLSPQEVSDKRYYSHIAAAFVIDTAVRILETFSVEEMKKMALSTLSQYLASYCKKLVIHKDTALKTVTQDRDIVDGIIASVETYSDDTYTSLLTPRFMEWYTQVYTLHPGRKYIGIDKVREAYLSPTKTTEALVAHLLNGNKLRYTPGSGMTFFGALSISVPFEMKEPGYFKYNGTILLNNETDLKQKAQELQQSGKVKMASVEKISHSTDEQYAEVVHNFIQELNRYDVNAMPTDQIDNALNTFKIVEGLSHAFELLGSKKSTENNKKTRKLWGILLWKKVLEKSSDIPHKDCLDLFNDIIDLSSSSGLRQPQEMSFIYSNYAAYLGNHVQRSFSQSQMPKEKALETLNVSLRLCEESVKLDNRESSRNNIKFFQKWLLEL